MEIIEQKKVEVVLATYNGEKHLREQLDSILAQSYSNILITIRDDGSTDATNEILKEYQLSYPEQINLIDNEGIRLGAVGSFSKLLEHTQYKYVFLSDQDDYWVKDKIQKQIDLIHETEQMWGNDCPLLVHSDLQLVDENLNILHPSVLNYIGRDPSKRSLNHLLVTNFIAGCSILINRNLLEIAVPFPPETLSHDGWLALVASAIGKIGFIQEPLIAYRQHGLNAIGAKRSASILRPKELVIKFQKFMFSKNRLRNRAEQAKALKSRTQTMLSPDQIKMIDAFVALEHKNYLLQRITILKYGFLKHTPFQIFSQLFQIV